MSHLEETNDWLLERELGLRLPICGVGFASQLDPGYRRFAAALTRLADVHGDSIVVRFLDVIENPSVAVKLSLTRTPTLVVTSFGPEFARWQGRIDMDARRFVIEGVLEKMEGTE